MNDYMFLYSNDLNLGWFYVVISADDVKTAYQKFDKEYSCLYSRVFALTQKK